MNACVIDWATWWDVLKAGVQAGIAIWAVRFAVSNFRKQKGIEFRTDWYRRSHFAIGETAVAVTEAIAGQPEEQRVAAKRATEKLLAIFDESYLLAAQNGHNAVIDLQRVVVDMDHRLGSGHPPSKAEAVDFAIRCARVANALALEHRTELQLGAVKKPDVPMSNVERELRQQGMFPDGF
ncbi:MAG: hypothetical protein ACO1Q7_12470 [Gemmatimonas sp.]